MTTPLRQLFHRRNLASNLTCARNLLAGLEQQRADLDNEIAIVTDWIARVEAELEAARAKRGKR